MASLEALYLHEPVWTWLGAAGLFVALNLATGSALLMWPALAAAVVAVIGLAGLRLELPVQAGVFVAVSAVLFGAAWAGAGARAPRSPRKRRRSSSYAARGAPPPAAGLHNQSGRLVGRIGRTSSVFMNGVGRVWIDGAEWGAEIDTGEEDLDEGIPVRVTKVIGGVRLQVHGLEA